MILAPTTDNITTCAIVLRAGGVIGMPTETVYGIAASIQSDEGLQRIFEVKGRPADNPLIVHVASVDEACELAADEYHSVLRKIAALFWPGALTCVVPSAKTVSPRITAGLSTVAVRMPQHNVARALIEELGCPVAAPSANRSGRPSPTTAQHVVHDLGPTIDVLDGGPCTIGLESTVIQLGMDTCTILRPGAVSREQLTQALGYAVDEATSHDDLRASPGTRYRHYAPTCPVVLCEHEDQLLRLASSYRDPILVLSEHPIQNLPRTAVASPLSESTIYAELRRADDLQLAAILVLCDAAVQRREALMNRLSKAAGSGSHGVSQ